jgi:hypothetical protein
MRFIFSGSRSALIRCLLPILFCLFLANVLTVNAQDLATIGEKNAVKVNGGVSVAQTMYGVTGMTSRRDPYNFYVTGNLNFSLYGWSVPLSFNYSNHGVTFQQPFNQYGLSPTYKWLTFHAGYRSMTFSPYTLNGHLFLGGGVELAPKGIFRLSAMYGRFQKAVRHDSTSQNSLAAYERRGYGIKAGIVKDMDYAYIIVFRARDEMSSLPYVPEEQQVTPQENLALGFSLKKNLFNKVVVTADWGTSAITRDLRAPEAEDGPALYKGTTAFYTFRTSSALYHAFKTAINYSANGYQVGVNYERIDPGYRTLGAYYFNNDLENITLTSSFHVAKVSFTTNAGLQRNDLDDTKASKLNRIVASVNAAFSPTERLQANLAFSNFRSYTRLRPKFEDLTGIPQQLTDTLNSRYLQISQTANAGINYRVGKKKNSINSVLTISGTEDNQDSLSTTTRLYYTTTTYNFVSTAIQASGSAGINLSWTDETTGGNRLAIGPVIQGSREFFNKKVKTGLSVSYNTLLQAGETSGGVLSTRLTASHRLKKKHNFNFSLINVNRKDQSTDRHISEFTANLNYGYSF